MKTLELERPSLAVLLSMIESSMPGYDCLFRGQSNSNWGLIPSLFRVPVTPSVKKLEGFYENYEEKCLSPFFREGLPYLPQIPRGYISDRILAQHFGVPTKLLDWTQDPFVATFFAVEDQSVASDCAIFLMQPLILSVEQLGSYRRDFIPQSVAIIPPAIDRRVTAQKSVFTIQKYGDPLHPFEPLDRREELDSEFSNHKSNVQLGLTKITIPGDFKIPMLKALLSIGIDRRNLFPGLDGVGADIAMRVKGTWL